MAYRLGKFEEKLTNIDKKQDEYNNIIYRTFVLEGNSKVQGEQIKVIDTDIHYTNKSIWVGLIVGALFGSCQLFQVLVEYFKYNNNESLRTCIIVFAILATLGYIIIDKFKK